jgi:hypothetical protein
MILRSDPPGATAYVDDTRIGVTPCETTFTHYGTRDVILEKEGFKRVAVKADLSVPWYQYPVLDVVTEVVIPFTITDEQHFDYKLEPAGPLPTRAEVLDRAHDLRERLKRENAAENSQNPPPKSQ